MNPREPRLRKQTLPQRNPLLAGAETAMHRAAQRAQKRALETAAHARRRYGRQEIETTCVTVTIRNPADPNRAWKGPFLVDAGATDSLVPRPHLESIGLRPKGRRVCELPDGREITMEITTADIEFMGEIVGGTILFGDTDAEPLLGTTALESAGIEIDPNNQQLKKRPAVRLKSLRQPI